MIVSRSGLAIAIVVGCVVELRAAAALAQATPQDSAHADALFGEGKKLYEGGRTHEACDKFAESMRLDPANGTLQNLALCHEKERKTATAWQEFTLLAERAGRDGRKDRAALGEQHAKALFEQLARVALAFSEGATVSEVRVDGTPLVREEWSKPIPLDPGDHVFTFSNGDKSDERRVTLADTPTTLRVDVPSLATPAAAPAPAVATPPIDSGAGGRRPLATRKILAITAGGAGLVALGVGTYLGLHAQALGNDATSKDGCVGGTCPTAMGVQDSTASVGAGNAATVLFVAGGVLAAGGVALWLTTPHASAGNAAPASVRFVPQLGPGVAGGVVSGAF
jgi:hypothetical protein